MSDGISLGFANLQLDHDRPLLRVFRQDVDAFGCDRLFLAAIRYRQPGLKLANIGAKSMLSLQRLNHFRCLGGINGIGSHADMRLYRLNLTPMQADSLCYLLGTASLLQQVKNLRLLLLGYQSQEV